MVTSLVGQMTPTITNGNVGSFDSKRRLGFVEMEETGFGSYS